MFKIDQTDVDKVLKFKKKMFWNKNHHHGSGSGTGTTPVASMKVNSSQQLNALDVNNKKLFNHSNLTSRSNSLHYISSGMSASSNRNSAIITPSSNGSSNGEISHNPGTTSNHGSSTSNVATSLANSTLKPFYNRLKKSHLFATKLEKICGPCSHENNRLPSQIMVIFPLF